MRNLTNKIVSYLFEKYFLNNQKFLNLIKNECGKFYQNDSLSCSRVWGDKSRVHLGKNIQINNALLNTVSGNIFIDDYSFFGHSVSLLTGTHDYQRVGIDRQRAVPNQGRDIVIEKGVWIGSNSIIIGPSRIGEFSVIAAGSLLKGDADAYSLYAGNPAVKIKVLNEI
jgi:acetyltransferase-like isoleucine patch superfamily enzyme